MASREIEWQFEAPSTRKAIGWLREVAGIELSAPAKQVDQYFDTPGHSLLRAGRSLRVRKTNDGFEATLKSLAPPGAPLRVRLEITEPLTAGHIGTLSSRGRISHQVRQIVGHDPLIPLVTVTTQRRKAKTNIARVPVEFSVDRFVASHEGRHADCAQRVEIEAARIGPAIETLANDLAVATLLVPAQGSKLEAAIRALGIEPSGVPTKADPQKEATLGSLATAIVRNQRRVLWLNEPIARLGEDPEGVHDMRVSLRRLRVALKFLGAAISADLSLPKEIEWLGAELSAVRDLDVLLGRVADWPEAKTVRKELLGDRRAAHRRLIQALNSRRYRKFVGALESIEARGPAASTPVASAAADLVEQAVTKARAAGRKAKDGDPVHLHKLRIRLKRLRYVVEFLRGIVPDESEKFISHMTRLQDTLGELQDLRVQAEWEQRLASHLPEGALAPVSAGRDERMAELAKKSMKSLRSALDKPYDSLHDALVDRCVTSWRPIPEPSAEPGDRAE